MTKRKTKNGDTRMLAAIVPNEVYDDFQRVALSHDRTVAAELRRLVRAHVEQHGERAAA
jgi:hypothetical protein